MNGAANGLQAPRGPQGRLANAALGALMAGVAPAGPRSRLSIVIFHRVHAQPDPLFPDDVDEQRFNAICAWLAAWYNVLPLDEAVQRLAEGRLPARPLCITFDDGYADNHDRALPILRAHGLCATFFIATGFLDGGRMWNDTVVESIRRCAEPGLDLSALGLPGIGQLDLRSVAARRVSMHSLLNAAKYLPPPQRQQVVDRVGALAGVHLPGDLMMRSDQVRAMAAAGMQIGAHTVTHPILARLDDEQARTEMQRSKAELESLLGRPVDLFAYPNGKPGQDYLPRDAQLARALGFRAAVSTVPGAARQGDGRMHELPRFTPWDQQRWKFGARMLRNVLADRPGA
jgi:peptidoglycan/xylan/chitin deacetylase (PgdA/CDA1 family)